MVMAKLILVSGDGHVGPPPEEYRPYLDRKALEHFDGFLQDHERWIWSMRELARFSDDVLDCMDERDAIRSGGETGAWDLDRRLQEMDAEGITAEALITNHQLQGQPFYSPMCSRWNTELQAAGVRAFHRWVADHIAGAPHRLIGMAEAGPCVDMEETVRELHWVADHGFRMVEVPGLVVNPGMPSLLSSHYEPFWATCDERGLVLGLHAGWGQPQDYCIPFWEEMLANTGGHSFAHDKLVSPEGTALAAPHEAAPGGGMMQPQGGGDQPENMMRPQGKAEPFGLTLAYGRAMWQLMLGGVFDRYPDLNFVLTEVHADWVPAVLEVLDRRFDAGDTAMLRKPSEYFESNVYLTPSSPRRHEIAMRHEIGVSKIMFARDFPHPESTWPNTWNWIRDAFVGVPEDEARLILGENAIRCFGLDRARLAEIADRIGPEPADLLGEFKVPADLVNTFDLRSGYLKPKNSFDEGELQSSFTEDLAARVNA